jgi:hypothetical protein
MRHKPPKAKGPVSSTSGSDRPPAYSSREIDKQTTERVAPSQRHTQGNRGQSGCVSGQVPRAHSSLGWQHDNTAEQVDETEAGR